MTEDAQKAREWTKEEILTNDSMPFKYREYPGVDSAVKSVLKFEVSDDRDSVWMAYCHSEKHANQIVMALNVAAQKDARITELRRILIDGIKSVGGNATDEVSDDFLSYLPLEIAGTLDQQKQEIADLRAQAEKDKAEIERLKKILVDSVNALTGCYAHPDVSIEFLANFPAEVKCHSSEAEKDKDRIVKLEEALKKSSPFAYRLLWLAFVWNDHNFGPAHTEARLTCEKHGIKSFDEGNAYLESVESALTPSTEREEK